MSLEAPTHELKAQYWAELSTCVLGEVGAWEARSPSEVLDKVGRGAGHCYSVRHKGELYNVVVELLENTEGYLHVMLEAQPDDPVRIETMADPPPRVGGGYSDRQMAMVSESFLIAR